MWLRSGVAVAMIQPLAQDVHMLQVQPLKKKERERERESEQEREPKMEASSSCNLISGLTNILTLLSHPHFWKVISTPDITQGKA